MYKEQITYCNFTNKRCYTEKAASEAINRARKHNRHYIPRRKYYCKECGYWHLTSTTYNKGASRKHPLKEIYK